MVRVRRQNTTLAARVQRAAHLAYIEGATEDEIADAVGIEPVTVRDWKKRPEWEAAIAELRAIQLEHASQRLASLTEKAVSAIDETLACDNLPLRFRAATNQLTDTNTPGNSRRDIARIKTAMRERNLVEN